MIISCPLSMSAEYIRDCRRDRCAFFENNICQLALLITNLNEKLFEKEKTKDDLHRL